jgi:hypothetical protein
LARPAPGQQVAGYWLMTGAVFVTFVFTTLIHEPAGLPWNSLCCSGCSIPHRSPVGGR